MGVFAGVWMTEDRMASTVRRAVQWAVLVCMMNSSPTLAQLGDNALIGAPEVECGQNDVTLQFTTKTSFTGKIFVKGHYAEEGCRVEYFDNAVQKPTAGITLRHGQCEMERQRMLNPQGMQFSAVIVVSFHPLFITKLDRAFHVKCLYREKTSTVTARIDVSMLPTTVLNQSPSMPVCTYTIRKDAIDGEVLRYARVGQQVVHRWECQSDMYGMLVHSCFVQDGQGQRMMVVDEQGCHKDRFLLGDPTYIEALNMAYREAHVFKFADRVAVRFECQIKLCMVANGGCQGITPPMCGANKRNVLPSAISVQPTTTTTTNTTETSEETIALQTNHTTLSLDSRRRRFRRENSEEEIDGILEFIPVDGDFQSQFIYVLDASSDYEEEEEKEGKMSSFSAWLSANRRGAIVRQLSNEDSGVCLSSLTFGILLACVVCVFVAIAAIGAMYFVQYQRKLVETGLWKA